MIKKLTLEGFQSHHKTVMDLDPGVNVVVGPSDVGKSAILRALGWALFNRPTGEAFVNKRVRRCEVAIETDKGLIQRVRKPFNGYKVNGKKLTAVGRTVPDEVSEVLDLNDVNVQNQLKPYFLVLESAGQFSRYVTEVLGLEVVDVALSGVKSQGRSAETDLELHKLGLADSKKEMEQFSDLDTHMEELDRVRDTEEKIADQLSDVSYLESALKGLNMMEDRIAKIGKLLVKMDLAETEAVMDTLIKYRDELLTVEDQLNLLDKSDKSEAELEQAVDSLSEDIKLAKSEYLATLKSFRFCPLCLSEIDESTVEGLAKRLEDPTVAASLK